MFTLQCIVYSKYADMALEVVQKSSAGRNLNQVTSLSEPAVEIKKVEKKVAVEIKKAI